MTFERQSGHLCDVALGTVEIAKSGVQQVKLRPHDAQSWKAINVRTVKFTPGQ